MTDEELANADPMDHYDEYADWLMSNPGLYICNGDDLVRYMEDGTRFEEFIKERK